MGGMLLRRRGREKRETPIADRSPCRIITMAWGDRYIDELLTITVPALLAPGNVPALVEAFDCEFVIVTETRLFERIACAVSILELMKHCALRLLPIDDLLSNWYGITLTYALVRGFADLGEAMTQTHLVFINADFIVADGSYRRLVEAIQRGERLIVAPSYCMVQEEAGTAFRNFYYEADSTLVIPPRQLASLILKHRHNTIRAKTVNQQLFRMHRYDQFYWHVNDATLLCRQFPIAVVYMRPERVLTEMPTFWDYGVVSEYCPTIKPCVLADSDDFLMAELRSRSAFSQFLHLGWPTPDEIATDWATFIVQDHLDYGKFPLILHSGDLSANIEAAQQQLDAYVGGVYRRLSAPVSNRNHRFWAEGFAEFTTARIRRTAMLLENQRAREAIRTNGTASSWLRRRRELRANIAKVETDLRAIRAKQQAHNRMLEARIGELKATFEREQGAIEAEQAPMDAHLEALRQSLSQQRDSLKRLAEELASEEQRLSPVSDTSPMARQAPVIPRMVRIYRAIFGPPSRTTPWHPYHASLRFVKRAIASLSTVHDILIVGAEEASWASLLDDIPARKRFTMPKKIADGEWSDAIGGMSAFDFCFCPLSFDELSDFPRILTRVRPRMRQGGKIVVFHHNRETRDLDSQTYALTQSFFPSSGTSVLRITGSSAGWRAMRWYRRVLRARSELPPYAQIGFFALLVLSAFLARIASAREPRTTVLSAATYCTSLTMEISTD